MPDLCRGGGSSTRPPYDSIATATGIALVGALSKILKRDTAVAVGAAIGGVFFDLSKICTQPAPAFPTLSPEDWFNVFSPVHTGDYLVSVENFTQWVTAYMWPTWCRCNDGGPPSATTPTPLPDVDSNPGIPTGTGGQHCWDQTKSFTQPGVGVGGPFTDYTLDWFPATQSVTVVPNVGGAPTTAQLMPAGVTNFQYAYSATDQAGIVTTPGIQGRFYDSSGTAIGNIPGPGCVNCASPLTPIAVPSGAVSWNLFGHSPNTAPYSATLEYLYDCLGSGPTSVIEPCCPPDPMLEYKLQQILNVVLNITSGGGVLPPSSWHDGVTHTSLRDSGSFNIDPKAMAIRYDVTTPPTSVRVEPGNPDFYWDMGFTTPYALTSPMRGIRLVFLHQTFVIPEFTDQIGYTLRHGTVMNATELLPTTP